jgi:hypothetical protein
VPTIYPIICNERWARLALPTCELTQNGLVTMPPSARSAAPLVALEAFEQT